MKEIDRHDLQLRRYEEYAAEVERMLTKREVLVSLKQVIQEFLASFETSPLGEASQRLQTVLNHLDAAKADFSQPLPEIPVELAALLEEHFALHPEQQASFESASGCFEERRSAFTAAVDRVVRRLRAVIKSVIDPVPPFWQGLPAFPFVPLPAELKALLTDCAKLAQDLVAGIDRADNGHEALVKVMSIADQMLQSRDSSASGGIGGGPLPQDDQSTDPDVPKGFRATGYLDIYVTEHADVVRRKGYAKEVRVGGRLYKDVLKAYIDAGEVGVSAEQLRKIWRDSGQTAYSSSTASSAIYTINKQLKPLSLNIQSPERKSIRRLISLDSQPPGTAASP